MIVAFLRDGFRLERDDEHAGLYTVSHPSTSTRGDIHSSQPLGEDHTFIHGFYNNFGHLGLPSSRGIMADALCVLMTKVIAASPGAPPNVVLEASGSLRGHGDGTVASIMDGAREELALVQYYARRFGFQPANPDSLAADCVERGVFMTAPLATVVASCSGGAGSNPIPNVSEQQLAAAVKNAERMDQLSSAYPVIAKSQQLRDGFRLEVVRATEQFAECVVEHPSQQAQRSIVVISKDTSNLNEYAVNHLESQFDPVAMPSSRGITDDALCALLAQQVPIPGGPVATVTWTASVSESSGEDPLLRRMFAARVLLALVQHIARKFGLQPVRPATLAADMARLVVPLAAPLHVVQQACSGSQLPPVPSVSTTALFDAAQAVLDAEMQQTAQQAAQQTAQLQAQTDTKQQWGGSVSPRSPVQRRPPPLGVTTRSMARMATRQGGSKQ